MNDKRLMGKCLKCGVTINSLKGKKRKRFFSDQCRGDWWNHHYKEIKKNKLKSFHEEKSFTGMDLFIKGLEMSSVNHDNMDILNFIVNNEFLLPDLSGNMIHTELSYAHEMAKYAKRNNKIQEFINVVVQTCQSNPNNNSLIEWFDALIYYNIDNKFNLREAKQNAQEKEE